MINFQNLQSDITSLPEEAQALLLDFISFLKQRYSKPAPSENISEKSAYQKFQDSGFIGCVSVEENLSTTYKQVGACHFSDE